MKKYLVVYSTTDNKPLEPENWTTFHETKSLSEAKKVFQELIKAALFETATYVPKIVRVAIMGDGSTPKYYWDRRDKNTEK